MKPTDEQIAKAKAAAGATGKTALLLPFDDFDLEVLVRDITATEFAEWVDHVATSQTNASQYLLSRVLLWPPLEVATSMMPAVGEEIAGLMLERAGSIHEKALVEAADVDKMQAIGVPADEAASLLAANPGKGRLAIFKLPKAGVTAVIRRPSADAFIATRDGEDAAKRENVGRYAVALNAAQDAIAWCAEPFDTMVGRVPGVVLDLKREFLRMGGVAAKVTLKSL